MSEKKHSLQENNALWLDYVFFSMCGSRILFVAFKTTLLYERKIEALSLC